MAIHSTPHRMILSFSLLALVAQPSFGGIEQAAKSDGKRESLRQIAFDGRCAVFVSAPFREISPSLTEVEIWRTCWGGLPDTQLGTKAGSAISLVRVDCGARQFATIEYAAFEKQLWQGDVVGLREMKSPMWKSISTGYRELQRLCLPSNDIRRHTTAFDGPGSKASD